MLISLKIDWCDLLMVQLSTTVHDHWEDHGLDYMDFYRQHDVSASQVKLVVKSPSVSTGEIKDMDSIPGSRRFP